VGGGDAWGTVASGTAWLGWRASGWAGVGPSHSA
jgi:hypothetical protein